MTKQNQKDIAPQVVDGHGHIFPYLGGDAGFDTADEHLLYAQRAMYTHGSQPVRRARDNVIVKEKNLWDPNDPSPMGRYDVDFRAGRNGRFEWTHAGEDYYIQFLPPSLQTMEQPADAMVTQMDYAGIDVAVLQNDHIYGSLNHYFAAAMQKYPGRFIGLAQVEEGMAFKDDQIQCLEHAVSKLGMRGLYFTTATFACSGYDPYYSDPAFDDFWNTVAQLGLPVYWVFFNSSPIGNFVDEMKHFQTWLERFPTIPSVLVHGLPDVLFADNEQNLTVPSWMMKIMQEFSVYMEVLYPLRWGGKWDYPYSQAHTLVQQYYDLFGPDKLIWGSDMPNVERYATYRQTLTYFTDYCDFIPVADKQKILGQNTLSLFKSAGTTRAQTA